MPLNTEDLGDVYDAKTPEANRAIYEGWAERYDADNLSKGFRLPGLGAAYAARHIRPGPEPVLDAGCGTGLVGESLSILGIGPLHGLDLSPKMLAAAKTRAIYAELMEHQLGTELPIADNSCRAVTCFGSFGPGHAPPESLTEFARIVRPGGHVIFNIVEATYKGQGFPDVMDALAAQGLWQEVERSPEFRAFLLSEPTVTTRIFVFKVL